MNKQMATFHEKTIHSLLELTTAAGLPSPTEITREHIHRQISTTRVKNYAQIYDFRTNLLLHKKTQPEAKLPVQL
jgi:hypothetical protein